MDGYPHSFPWPRAVLGGLHHPADDLVAQHEGIPQDRFPRRPVKPVVEVGTADASELYRHEGLVRPQRRFREEIHSEIAASMGDDGANACCCLHSLFPLVGIVARADSWNCPGNMETMGNRISASTRIPVIRGAYPSTQYRSYPRRLPLYKV